MTFTLSSENPAIVTCRNSRDFPIIETPEDLEQATLRCKKLISTDEFAIRWGFSGRKEGVDSTDRYRESQDAPKFESEKQFKKFRDEWEEFIHPTAYWESEDGEWYGIGPDEAEEWYGKMIQELYTTLIGKNEDELASLSRAGMEKLCRSIHEKVLTTKDVTESMSVGHSQLSSLPDTFTDTLWGDVLEYCELFIRILLSGKEPPSTPLLRQEHVLKFSADSMCFSPQPYNPLDEILENWDPKQQVYYDENYPVAREPLQKRKNASEADITSIGGVTHISRRKLYKTLLQDTRKYITKNTNRGSLTKKAREDTGKYLENGTVVYALMKKVETLWEKWYGEYMVFIDGVSTTPDDERMMRLIESVKQPIAGDDEDLLALSLIEGAPSRKPSSGIAS